MAHALKKLNNEAVAAQSLVEALSQMTDDDACLQDTLEGETGLIDLIQQTLVSIDDDQVLLSGIDQRISELDTRKKRIKDRAETKRGAIEQALMIAGLAKVELSLATLFLSDRAPQLVVNDESEIPAQFFKRADPKLDKAALKKAIKDGETVPGASLSNGAPSLTIRRK